MCVCTCVKNIYHGIYYVNKLLSAQYLTINHRHNVAQISETYSSQITVTLNLRLILRAEALTLL